MQTWIEAEGIFCAPGGDPVWECPSCGGGRHVYGVKEFSIPNAHKDRCPDCGAFLQYPWEAEGRRRGF